MHVEIHVTAGPARGQQFVFTQPAWFLIGREPDAQISLPDDPYISRRHCFLKLFPSGCVLRDLDSTNGVLVNGVRYGGKNPQESEGQRPPLMTEVDLNHEDEIVIGDTRIHILIDDSPDLVPSNETAMLRKKDDAPPNVKPVDTLYWHKRH